MAENSMEQARLSEAAGEVGRRVADNPHTSGEITAGHVQMLLDAGIPGATIAELLRVEGVEESEVAGYAVGGSLTPSTNIIIGTICVGTCGAYTIVVDCQKSFRGD